jgi:hypothetical protein
MAITDNNGVVFGDTAASSYYTNILQDFFLPAMADAVIYPNTLLKRLPRTTRNVEGKLIRYPVHYDDATGAVAIAAGGLLPDPDTEKFAQYAFGIKHMYVRLKFDGITKDAAKTNKASWLQVIVYEAKAKTKIMARARQRIYHNDGSGRLAEVVSHSGGAVQYSVAGTLTLRINQGIESPSTCDTAPTRWLKPGMLVAFVTSTGTGALDGTVQAVGRIATVPSTTTVTLSGVVNVGGANVAAGDYVVTVSQLVATAALKDTGFRNEMMGLAGILSDADPADGTSGGFQGIDSDSATNAWLRATIQGNSGVKRPVTMDVLDYGWTTAIEIGDGVPTAILGTFAQVRAVAKALIVDRRFVGTKRFDGGYEAIVYNDAPLISDRDMYDNRLALLDETDLEMNVLADPQWMDADGSVYSRLQEKDEYQATMFLRENLSSTMRKKHVLITDLVQ